MAVGDRDGMDDLDRLFRHLVSLLADQSPERLHAPIEVAELYQHIVPYRQHRVALKFDTNQDYEMAVLRLLSGERGYASVEPPEAQRVLREEAESANPDLGLFREFAAARLRLDANAVRTALGARSAFVPSIPAAAPPLPAPPYGKTAPPPPAPRPPHGSTASDLAVSEGASEAEGNCPYCGQGLPVHREVFYCPFCGGNVKGVECPKCGTGLEVGWMFCVTCGHRMGRG